MKKHPFLHVILGLIALIFIPVFYLAFNISGMRITFAEFLQEWARSMGSDESWGLFDK